MASAFPAILVYAHELLPGRVGLVSGVFFGFAFGLDGLDAAVMGRIADAHGIGQRPPDRGHLIGMLQRSTRRSRP